MIFHIIFHAVQDEIKKRKENPHLIVSFKKLILSGTKKYPRFSLHTRFQVHTSHHNLLRYHRVFMIVDPDLVSSISIQY